MTRTAARAWLFAAFTASGFAGLIYESVWSHYLRLFLGHAAYAQALVLAIFMGGMALGAWYCGLRSERWRGLLFGYAVAEAAIGLFALWFHPLFVGATEFAHGTLMPALAGYPLALDVFKWLLAALLILPQSVLLGMTFPLMSAGILRLHPERQGETLAMLYFTNCLGAAAGVLASGFVLIGKLGLHGAILAAGLVNLALALFVWLLARRAPPASPAPAPSAPHRPAADRGFLRAMLAISLLTGAASFLYEVGWIRMLTMVLGSSSHAFELMLSAFILGLAFGGLWIRRRIDGYTTPEKVLGVVQVAMGLLALATLPVYGQTFRLMSVLIDASARTEAGYVIFNAGSHLIALSVMLPATFCAGMTLPLITHILLRHGAGERAIGTVYAINTVGAIAGVFTAVHFALPVIGLKGLIMLGAAIDIALGIVLLWRYAGVRLLRDGAAVAGAAALVATAAWVRLDPMMMASGIFRHGRLPQPGEAEVIYYRDGKTSTVHLVRAGGLVSVLTNGKSDAMVAPDFRADTPGDEPTMVMIAALPLALRPDARTAAVIGIGSGISSHVLLASESLRELDTIEIEPAMVEAARAFRARSGAVFDDPRSRIRIEDAKTYFSLSRKRYDIVVSQPSNPWVSGVSSLFTEEFYRRVKDHLAPGGLFVQWLQLYDISPALVASVLKALARNFANYEIYAAAAHDIVIVAGDAHLPRPSEEAFRHPRFARELARLQVRSAADLEVFRIGSRKVLHPYFNRYTIPPNSDYFPVLDQNAARDRFMARGAGDIVRLAATPIPAGEFLGDPPDRAGAIPTAPRPWWPRSQQVRAAQAGRAYLLDGGAGHLEWLPGNRRSDFQVIRQALVECRQPRPHLSEAQLFAVAEVLLPHLPRSAGGEPWKSIMASSCARLDEPLAGWLGLFAAVGMRDVAAMTRLAEAGLADPAFAGSPRRDFLLAAAIVGRLAQGERDRALALWRSFADGVTSEHDNMLPELLQGHLFAPDSAP
jgi:predicted membrane-bound spermidine synthase